MGVCQPEALSLFSTSFLGTRYVALLKGDGPHSQLRLAVGYAHHIPKMQPMHVQRFDAKRLNPGFSHCGRGILRTRAVCDVGVAPLAGVPLLTGLPNPTEELYRRR